ADRAPSRGGSVRGVLATIGLLGGCLAPDALSCPAESTGSSAYTCAPQGGCAYPDQVAACASLHEEANCTAESIGGDGLCLSRVCEAIEWTPEVVIGGRLRATEIGLAINFTPIFAPTVASGVAVDSRGNVYV